MYTPFLLLLVSTLILWASAQASAQETPPAPPFRAGAATSNLTPPLGASLDGVIQQNGLASHVHDELFARCLVLDDGITRIAFAIVDNTMISREIMDQARAIIEEQSDLPGHHVLISATHTHSSPRAVHGLNDAENDLDYLDFMARRIADGVQRAINNLAPARIGWASAPKPEWVHNRRWFMNPDKIPPHPRGETGEHG
jgi:neutral ceramidase